VNTANVFPYTVMLFKQHVFCNHLISNSYRR